MSETNVNISLTDIVNVVSLIDIVSSRGAFKGVELTSVGSIRDKLSLFIEQNKQKEEPKDEEKTSEEDITTIKEDE